MAETPKTSPRIEELKGRLAADPKSRLFFPLAEEFRKVGEFAEAEQVLRGGLEAHPTYLSAWISLGRVLKELCRHEEGIEVLDRAMTLDPGNVVAARLLADSHLALGDRVEAIKKYKLVRALHPADDELDELIERLEREIEGASQAQTDRMELPSQPPAAPDEAEAPGDEEAIAAAPPTGEDVSAEPPAPEAPVELPEHTAPFEMAPPTASLQGTGTVEMEPPASPGEPEPAAPSAGMTGGDAEPFGAEPATSDVSTESLEPSAASSEPRLSTAEEPFPSEGPLDAEATPLPMGADDQGSPFADAADEAAEGAGEAVLAGTPTGSEETGEATAGRNRAKIERLEGWLRKMRGA